MKQFSNLQSHGLDRIEELSGAEAAQINGGFPESFYPYIPIWHEVPHIDPKPIKPRINIIQKKKPYYDNYVNNFSNEYLDSFVQKLKSLSY